MGDSLAGRLSLEFGTHKVPHLTDSFSYFSYSGSAKQPLCLPYTRRNVHSDIFNCNELRTPYFHPYYNSYDLTTSFLRDLDFYGLVSTFCDSSIDEYLSTFFPSWYHNSFLFTSFLIGFRLLLQNARHNVLLCLCLLRFLFFVSWCFEYFAHLISLFNLSHFTALPETFIFLLSFIFFSTSSLSEFSTFYTPTGPSHKHSFYLYTLLSFLLRSSTTEYFCVLLDSHKELFTRHRSSTRRTIYDHFLQFFFYFTRSRHRFFEKVLRSSGRSFSISDITPDSPLYHVTKFRGGPLLFTRFHDLMISHSDFSSSLFHLSYFLLDEVLSASRFYMPEVSLGVHLNSFTVGRHRGHHLLFLPKGHTVVVDESD